MPTFHAVKVKVWALVALVSILSIGISACEGSNHFGKENTVQLTQEEEILPSDIELAKDSDMQELLTLRDAVVLKIVSARPDMAKLKLAVQEKNEAEIIRLMGYTQEEVVEWHRKMKASVSTLLQKYPALGQKIRTEQSCTNCNTTKFFDNFDQIAYLTIANRAEQQGQSGSNSKVGATLQDCQWKPYFSQLLVCGYSIGYLTAVSPPIAVILYGACAYDAICSYCQGNRTAHALCN